MKLPTALSLAALSFQLHASAAGDAHNVNVDTPSAESALEYGVDVSFPMHHSNVTAANDNPLGDKQKFYEDLIQGCVEHYDQEKEGKGQRCLNNEKDRVAMSLRQPKGMFNYTKLGYTKIRAPENVFKLIKEFWEANKDKQSPERWPAGNT